MIICTEFVGELLNGEGQHPAVEAALKSLKESRESWRHLYQNSSILHCMSEAGILQSGNSSTYVEFGSGRGEKVVNNLNADHNTNSSFFFRTTELRCWPSDQLGN